MENSIFQHSKLPQAFSEYGKLDATDLLKLEAYFQRFVWDAYPIYREGHLLLACYAAMPAAITPDLLYRIWLNFRQFQSNDDACMIDRVAVSDLLLSSLLDEVSPEVFEMPITIRNALLYYWKTKDDKASGISATKAINADVPENDPVLLRPKKMEEVARFLAEYAETTEANRVGKAFAKAQRWTALSFFNPRQAAAELATELKAAQNAKDGNPSLQRRLADAVAKMGDRIALGLTSNPPSSEFRDFQDYLKANLYVLQGDEQKAKEMLQHIEASSLTNEPDKKAVASFQIKGNQLPEKRKIDAQRPTIYALLVGINNYATGMHAINGAVNDIMAFKEYFSQYAEANLWNFSPLILLDELATRAKIIDAFQHHFGPSRKEDHLVFCFSGHAAKSSIKIDATNHIETSALVCYDSRTENGKDLYLPELSWLISQATKERDNPMLVILDAAHIDSLNKINYQTTR